MFKYILTVDSNDDWVIVPYEFVKYKDDSNDYYSVHDGINLQNGGIFYRQIGRDYQAIRVIGSNDDSNELKKLGPPGKRVRVLKRKSLVNHDDGSSNKRKGNRSKEQQEILSKRKKLNQHREVASHEADNHFAALASSSIERDAENHIEPDVLTENEARILQEIDAENEYNPNDEIITESTEEEEESSDSDENDSNSAADENPNRQYITVAALNAALDNLRNDLANRETVQQPPQLSRSNDLRSGFVIDDTGTFTLKSGLKMTLKQYCSAANAPTLRKRINHILRAMWSPEQLRNLRVRSDAKKPNIKIVTDKDYVLILRSCMELQVKKKLPITEHDDPELNLRS